MSTTTTTPRTRTPWAPIRATFAALGLAAVTLTGAAVATAAPASATEATAVVRSAHFSPDTAGVDVYLAPFSGGSTTLWVSNETYGSISPYQRITPGAYVVSMRPHDAPATSTPTITWTLDAKAGAAYTAAAIGTSSDLQAVILNDDLTAPAADTGRVRIVQAASAAPSVTVSANGGVVLADELAFGATSDYRSVPTGAWDVRVIADGGGTNPVTSAVAVPAGSSNTVVVLDGKDGGLTLTSVQDSASSGVMPVGSVDAGAGGTATDFQDASTGLGAAWGLIVALGVVVTAGGTALLCRRHRAAA